MNLNPKKQYKLYAKEESYFDTGTLVTLLFTYSDEIPDIGKPTMLMCKGVRNGKVVERKCPIYDFLIEERKNVF